MIRYLAVILSLSACSGSDPTECDPNDRIGTYLVEYTTISGNCGDIPSQLLRFDPGAQPDPSCALIAPTIISDRGCTLQTKALCAGELDATVTGVSTANADASKITGTATIQTDSCIGTYKLKYTRQ